MVQEPRWEPYARDCYAAGNRVLANAPVWGTAQMEVDDPKLLAALVLVRTLSNFEGALILARSKKIIEARVLTRCCFENLFIATAISEEGEKFVRKMIEDHKWDRRARAEFLLVTNPGPADGELRGFIKSLGKKPNGRPGLAPKTVSGSGPLRGGYAFYAALSADAAHPTIDSLNRYIEEFYENGALRRNLVAQPTPDEDELTFTMHLACDALLGVCAMVHGIIGGPEDLQLGELIRSMPDRASQDIGEIER